MGGYPGIGARAALGAQILAAGVLLFPACAPARPPDKGGDGELVLELGGANRSLAKALAAAGVRVLPAVDWAAEPPAAAQAPMAAREPHEPAPSAAAPRGAPAAEPEPRAPAAPAPAWLEVELQPRQTVIDLAKKHLGSGNRFKEILALNGWTDADARRLRAGQKVRVPRTGTAP